MTYLKFIHFHAIAILITLLFIGGCESKRGLSLPKTAVSGTVTYQGKSLAGGRIAFVHESGHALAADIDASGRYTAEAYQGTGRVTISSRGPDQPNPRGKPAFMPGKSLIPEKYDDPQTSRLKFDAQSGENQLNFDLK